jgi:hypothetical protein
MAVNCGHGRLPKGNRGDREWASSPSPIPRASERLGWLSLSSEGHPVSSGTTFSTDIEQVHPASLRVDVRSTDGDGVS